MKHRQGQQHLELWLCFLDPLPTCLARASRKTVGACHTQMQLQRADDRLKNVGKEERDQRLGQLQRLHEEAAAVQKQHVGGWCGWLEGWLAGGDGVGWDRLKPKDTLRVFRCACTQDE